MNRRKRSGAWILILGLSLYLMILTGCGDSSEDPVQVRPSELDQLRIICHDLAPAPDELAQLTVVVDGYSPGVWPTYTWTATGGSFPDTTTFNKGISVKWLTPETPGLYNVQVIGTLGGLADTSSTWVLVKNFQEINTGVRFSCAPKIIFNNLYFFGGYNNLSPRNLNFIGFHCYQYTGPGASNLISNSGVSGNPPTAGGYDLFLPDEGTAITGSFIMGYYAGLEQQRQDTWYFPLLALGGTRKNITNDSRGVMRKNQHTHPYIDPAGTRVVWQAELAGIEPDGTDDLSDIGHWDKVSNDTIYLTESHDWWMEQHGTDWVRVDRYYRNIRPIFTPAEDLLIYFVDTTGVFEPCLIDIDAGVPQIDSRRALMVSSTIGIFEASDIDVSDNTVFQWNDLIDILAFVDDGGDLCFFYPYTGIVTKVPGIDEAKEVVWSPDGVECAVVTETGIAIVSAAGVVADAPVFTKEKATDGIYGLNWSPDTAEPKLAFRMVRKGRNVEDSFSALMISFLNEGFTVYASPSVNWITSFEPEVDYTYMRLFFDADETIYAPIPTPPWSGEENRTVECAIFKCYD